MRTRKVFGLGAVGALVAAGLAGCVDDAPTGTAAGGPITVKATDTSCELSRAEVSAGSQTFAVTNSGGKVTEFYVYGAGDRVMGEVENIAPGLTRELKVELTAGAYQTACKPGMIGAGIRTALTVTGSAAPLAADAALAGAAENYQRYVRSQTAALLERTGEFVAAVKAGDVARAKMLYPVARTYWERIEPVAEVFGDLDPRIDGREDVIGEGMAFTGFHRIEKDLWTTGDIIADGPIADQLLADVREIVAKADAEKLSPLNLANGAKELLDEVATGKITGEEERYSHTDLWDFNANLEGSKAAITALRPALEQRAPELVKRLDAEFARAAETLGRHRAGDGWKPHDRLTPAELKELSDVVNALAEPVSQVAGVIATR